MSKESVEPYLDPRLQARLERCTSLPSPPVVALRVIELAQDPEVDIGRVADVISMDPALAAKVLRVANSPIYALRRKAETLHQAITLLGLNGTLMLALSFSLASTMSGAERQGFDYTYFWKRSLAAATCARRLGAAIRLRTREELFLASLLQDIGMLVVDKMDAGFYADPGVDQHDHEAVVTYERSRLGADHAALGSWILGRWGFPEYLLEAVLNSHAADFTCNSGDCETLDHCVVLSGLLADAMQNPTERNNLAMIAALAEERLGMDVETFREMMEALNGDLAEAQVLFDTDLSEYTYTTSLLDNAKETLMMMNLQTLQQADRLQETAEILESRTRELEERSRRDGLTGLYNRAYLDQQIAHEFGMASERDWSLAVIFVDLDHFKQVNDTHGHQAGDLVLQRAARALVEGTRDDDIVARYGGEEFVIVMPGHGEKSARVVADRLVNAFRGLKHNVGDGTEINVTVSIGIAVMGENEVYRTVDRLVEAADKAVYLAKKNGRNCYVIHGDTNGNSSGVNGTAVPAA